ncbi:stage V sporulation protein AB [Anaerocolumna jejuensis DSM 15929]|uniref:Stage V sporulation protein AB n=1 Tax=Anaerocolumna jejuensis DSM 15929 TaxID=1121322 RepID=A0A1M6Y6Q7_9FIRM|nr:stage V sporulation protein AB [Anaerocolumna jejuensis]SHL13897.1 stage V sporulation protein AB [Anaerocolumna jejuensis DSM 15929]
MFIKYAFLCFLGLTAGILIAAGTVAFITIVGVLTRLAIRTDTAKRILLYEDIVVVGATFGNIMDLFRLPIPVGTVGLIIFGLFIGCFIGCLAVALEEVIQIFPIMTHRLKLKMGIPIIVLFLALGKGLGAFFQLFIHYKK